MSEKTKYPQSENIKYSELYKDGYPQGNPFGIVKEFNYDKEETVLDLGCGRANLARYFDNYTGVDVSDYIINVNKKNYPNKTFYSHSIDNLRFLRNKKYDLVICCDVMEHIPSNKISSVLFEMFMLNSDKVSLSISTRKSVFLDNNGKNLHLTVWSPDKWINEIEKLFIVKKKSFKNNLLNVELYRINDQKTIWKNFHQDFELNYHKQGNYRRRDDLWKEVWYIIYNDFMTFNKNEFNDSDILLDIGCGSRPSLEWFNFGDKHYLDPLLSDYINIPEMKEYWKDKNIYSQPAEELVDDLIGKCDFVQCWNVLDHSYNWRQIINNIIKYLKPNGILLLGTDLHKVPYIGHNGIDDSNEMKKIINDNFNILKTREKNIKVKYLRDFTIKANKI